MRLLKVLVHLILHCLHFLVFVCGSLIIGKGSALHERTCQGFGYVFLLKITALFLIVG